LTQRDFLTSAPLLALLTGGFLVGIAAERFANGAREVTDHAHMDRNVVLLGCAGEREGMVLPDRHFWAAHEDILDDVSIWRTPI
jgi:hypothetical protein